MLKLHTKSNSKVQDFLFSFFFFLVLGFQHKFSGLFFISSLKEKTSLNLKKLIHLKKGVKLLLSGKAVLAQSYSRTRMSIF